MNRTFIDVIDVSRSYQTIFFRASMFTIDGTIGEQFSVPIQRQSIDSLGNKVGSALRSWQFYRTEQYSEEFINKEIWDQVARVAESLSNNTLIDWEHLVQAVQ